MRYPFPPLLVLLAAFIAVPAAVRAQSPAAPSPADSVRLLIDARRPDDAVALAERLPPDSAPTQVLLARAWFAKALQEGGLGAFIPARKGKAAAERAVALDPNNLDARELLLGFHLRAPGIIGGSKEEAVRQAEAIASRDRVRGFGARLAVATTVKDTAALAALFDDALPLIDSPEDRGHRLAIGFGNALADEIGRLDLPDFQERLAARSYAAKPKNPYIRYARARVWVAQGTHLAEAERLLREYAERRAVDPGAPPPADALAQLAQLRERRGAARLTAQ